MRGTVPFVVVSSLVDSLGCRRRMKEAEVASFGVGDARLVLLACGRDVGELLGFEAFACFSREDEQISLALWRAQRGGDQLLRILAKRIDGRVDRTRN